MNDVGGSGGADHEAARASVLHAAVDDPGANGTRFHALTLFRLSEPDPPQIVQTPLGEKHIAVQVSTVVQTPDGRRAFGVGGCTTKEILSKRSGNDRAYHDAVACAHTRAKERAIADLVGGGEVTAEEIGYEDKPTPF